ncbi:ROK family protein [Hydrogenobacter hydrogenophilus]|uniref:Glucokinase n=1 Tax=Hydrogenobacter hydrogenophilus TaxID=35835 RepID=A0A285P4E8_9AQUI|nr:ROK family protein [Hydrogenobacter hydrogenophilus]SNZ16043.1 glucokinase [Hydrogenobacter hydrogenophilus]
MRKGIDIGGTFIKVLWEDGRRQKVYVKDLSRNRESFLRTIVEISKEGSPEAVGVAVAGFTSLDGVIYKSPNIPALDGVPLREILLSEGVKCVVGNDVSFGAYGEWYYEHRNSKCLLFVAIGTGLGAGLVIKGEPYLGACGSALELGHHIIQKDGKLCSCGRRGCWEAYCSSYGFERIYKNLSGEELRDYQIVQKAKEGDRNALMAVEEFKNYLITGLMNAVHILNPDTLVLGGGLLDSMRTLLEGLEDSLISSVERLPASCLSVFWSSCEEFCMARGALAMSFGI